MNLTIYGDFNCPFSALASVRADLLLATGFHNVHWRAIQHDRAIPAAGAPVDRQMADELAVEIATIHDLSEHDVRLHLAPPPVRSKTALACAAFASAGAEAHRLRRRLFAAVWAEGRNLGDPAELRRLHAEGRDVALARRWQEGYDALPRPLTPTLVLPDGSVSGGFAALAHLADLATAVRSS